MRRTVSWVAVGLSIVLSTPVLAASVRGKVRRYRAAHESAIVSQLAELTSLRSVAANPSGLSATADRLEALLRERGFEAAQLHAEGAPPLVVGTLRTPGARRTVAFYAHYDGQPVSPSQWRSDPFTPVMRSGPLGSGEHEVDWRVAKPPFDPQWRLFGRAAADDKASIVAFLAAFDALRALRTEPTVNLKVVWEGEEEAGSPHLPIFLRQNRDLLGADLWLIGDGPVHASRRQMLYFGARGLLGLEATVYGPLRPAHDGHYGNWIPNPAIMAAELVASLRDSEGRILVPGFSEDVRPLTEVETRAIATLPPVEDGLRRQFALGRSEGSEGLTMSTMRPALNVRGISAGKIGAEATNSIPSEAMVSIDFRLVPDQTPEKVRTKVESFLRTRGWTLVKDAPSLDERLSSARLLRLRWDDGYRGLRTDMSSPPARAVMAAAGERVAVLPMMGASVPIYMIDEVFHAPVVGLPIVNHDDNQHAADENLRLANLWEGMETYAAMMAELTWE